MEVLEPKELREEMPGFCRTNTGDLSLAVRIMNAA
ncbi:MAG: hypothetical protein HPY50_04095 [Firmicutes bacterium]|nr:hypothetical protein [Bacillota bacterium]